MMAAANGRVVLEIIAIDARLKDAHLKIMAEEEKYANRKRK
jgi:hypothetical protein